MTNILTHIKKVVMAYSYNISAFLLFSVSLIAVSSLISCQKVAEIEHEKFSKTFGDVDVVVYRKFDGKTSRFFVSVVKANKSLVSNYELPTKQYDLNWIKITNVSLVPVKENEYRIILYSAVYDCDEESGHYIWFLKLSNQMNLVKMIALSDIHNANENASLLFGNKIISLPSFSDFKYELIIVPIEIGIGDTIRTAPMLNQRSIDMMQHYYGNEISKRVAKLIAASDGVTLEKYRKADNEFKEVLSERTYLY